MRLVAAYLRRDLADDLSYRLTFALELVDAFVLLAAVFLFSRGLGPVQASRYEPFAFLFVGLSVNTALSVCLAAFATSVRGSRAHGMLRVSVILPTPPSVQVVAAAGYPFLRGLFDAGLHLLAAGLLGVSLSLASAPAALLVFLLGLGASASVGIASAAFALVFKRGDPLLWLFGVVSLVLGGVFYPVDSLPPLLRAIAWLTPVAPTLAAMRPLLLEGAPLSAVLHPVLVLSVYAGAGLPVSLMLFNAAMRQARRLGTIKET